MDDITKTPSEIAVAEEANINAESAAAEQAAQATPAEKEAAQQEEKNLQELDKDEDFHKTVPKNFSQNKDWRKLYWQRKEAERKAKEYEEQIQALSTQEQEEVPPEITEERLQALAKEKGYTLTKAQAEDIVAQDKADEFAELLKNATPEEKDWWGKYNKAMVSHIDRRDASFKEAMTDMYVDHILGKSEKQAMQYIDNKNKQEKLSIDYKTDIEPEIVKLLKTRQYTKSDILQGNISVLSLTKEIMADLGVSLGKKLSLKEQAELTEKKKKANMETQDSLAQKGQDDFAGKSPSEIMAELYRREGVS